MKKLVGEKGKGVSKSEWSCGISGECENEDVGGNGPRKTTKHVGTEDTEYKYRGLGEYCCGRLCMIPSSYSLIFFFFWIYDN